MIKQKEIKELVNFSIYPCDIERFGGDWSSLEQFVSGHGLNGLELLVGNEPLPEIPAHLVHGVHLPSPFAYFKLLTGDPDLEGLEEWEINIIYGGRNREELISRFCNTMENVSAFDPAYAVFHVSYVETDQVFTRNHGCTDEDVLCATADLLNEAVSHFPDGEPPVRLFFENLWWPGLTLLDPELTLRFSDMLDFNNWAFLLDTGHFMNATMCCNEENCAVGTVLDRLDKLPREIIEKIEGMHFHYSLSGDYQKESILPQHPPHLQEKNFSESYMDIMEHVGKIDQHMPFSITKCKDIVDIVSPNYLTHEFVTKGLDELDRKLRLQCGSLNGNQWTR
ncbi:Xylose isomerase-like TIM barrel [Methanococcoides vulcani]|uniref:Xylose isomerase-like TIM barrel n=1 Tax=Methanococcoides vulcani TaxID=1353158 RepID=A0A1H9YMJ9_9EURY|nr:TIM barrel protein [Methanococcoides vulcani]SES70309.1 Xylose isomerase-like TIM barrel [Methanococcoides vulcani]